MKNKMELIKKYTKLSYVTLTTAIWNIAEITLPLLLTKRILDTREEYIENVLKKTRTMPMYNVSNSFNHYFITWEDITAYQNNLNEEKRTFSLKKYPEIKITTNAKTQQHFLAEVMENFQNKKIN